MATINPPRDRSGFRIAIFCALPLEAEMVQAIFQRNWTNEGIKYNKAPGDSNSYTTGMIGDHHVVLTHMAEMGGNNAAASAAFLKSSFRRVEIAFLVGICGAAPIHPETMEEVILGDCIVSTAMIQYDFGRQLPNGFSRKRGLEDCLGRSNPETRAMISRLRTPQNWNHLADRLVYHLQGLQQYQNVQYPGPTSDRLYDPAYSHKHYNGVTSCSECSSIDGSCSSDCDTLQCGTLQLISRSRFQNHYRSARQGPNIHFGRIGSANSVMKSGITRDHLASVDKIVGFEMEGAGIWEHLPTIMIKSVCDYADSHKNKGWQRYASASSAACLKALFEQWEAPESSPVQSSFSIRAEMPQMGYLQPPNLATMLPVRNRNQWDTQGSTDRFPLLPGHFDTITQHQMFTDPRFVYANSAMGMLPNLFDTRARSFVDQVKEIDMLLKVPLYEDPLTHISSTRLDGTCDWIFNRPFYQDWLRSPSSTNTSFLWLHAGAGNGKTILCASLVKALKASPQLNVFHYFASGHTQSGKDLSGIVRYWISEIARRDQGGQKNLDLVQATLFQYSLGRVISAADVWILFGHLLSQIRGCVFVLDGLDEYDTIGRKDFLSNLKAQLAWKGAKVLVTSRDEADIRINLAPQSTDNPGLNFTSYRITENDTESDIGLFSNSVINRGLPNQDASVRSDLATTLAERCGGMFLWVKLASQQLDAGQSPAALDRVVNKAPTGLSMVYMHKWDTIMQEPDEEKKLRAIAILRWCVYAFTPLTIGQLVEALAVSVTDTREKFDSRELPNKIDEVFVNYGIKGLCGSFVELRAENIDQALCDHTIHLIHGSVKDFLLEVLPEKGLQRSKLPSENIDRLQHHELSKVCLRYLCYQNVVAGFCHENGLACTFRSYAIYQWDGHQKASQLEDSEFIAQALRFLNHENRNFVDWSSSIVESPKRVDEAFKFESALPFYYAALLGLDSTLKDMHSSMSESIDAVGGFYGTALQAACAESKRPVFDLLLSWHADLNVEAGYYDTALIASAFKGNSQMVKDLLAHGSDPKQMGRFGFTALMAAASQNMLECAQLLLKSDINILDFPRGKLNPFLVAVRAGHLKIVEFLMNHGADISNTNSGQAALHYASFNGHLEVTRLLLDRGADITISDDNGATSLHYAAFNNHLEVIRFLLDRGANIEAPANSEQTPLHFAVIGCHLEVTKYLLDQGGSPATSDNLGWTPLHHAANEGHLEIVKLLLDRGADMGAFERDGWNPLHFAVYDGHLETTKLLLDRGANIAAFMSNGHSALHLAAQQGQLETVKLLLDSGADIAAPTSNGHSALHLAVQQGQLETVEFLLDSGADIAAPTSNGRSALHLAALQGQLETVKSLLDLGADAKAWDASHTKTPLHCAIRQGTLAIVKLLFEKAATNSSFYTNYEGRTLLHDAAGTGNIEIYEYFIIQGLDTNLKDAHGRGVLEFCCMSGSIELLERILGMESIHTDHVLSTSSWSPLHWVCRRGSFDMIRRLSTAGVATSSITTSHPGVTWSPLDVARFHGNQKLITNERNLQQGHQWEPLRGYGIVEMDESLVLYKGVFSNTLGPVRKRFGGFCDGCGLVGIHKLRVLDFELTAVGHYWTTIQMLKMYKFRLLLYVQAHC